jgi:hypothetical protein
MKKTTIDELADYLTKLILGGATDVGLDFMAGFTVLRWKFPDQPGGCLPLEMDMEESI